MQITICSGPEKYIIPFMKLKQKVVISIYYYGVSATSVYNLVPDLSNR